MNDVDRTRGRRPGTAGDTRRRRASTIPRNEKDSCGVGFVCDVGGKASHSIVERGIEVLNNLLHRGAAGADAGTGDGAGILDADPAPLLRRRVPLARVRAAAGRRLRCRP